MALWPGAHTAWCGLFHSGFRRRGRWRSRGSFHIILEQKNPIPQLQHMYKSHTQYWPAGQHCVRHLTLHGVAGGGLYCHYRRFRRFFSSGRLTVRSPRFQQHSNSANNTDPWAGIVCTVLKVDGFPGDLGWVWGVPGVHRNRLIYNLIKRINHVNKKFKTRKKSGLSHSFCAQCT